jgi:hypothetical protein
MKILIGLSYALLIVALCLTLGAAAGWLVMLAPCNWFGSNFEGGCGYAGMRWIINTAMLTTIVALLIVIAILPWLSNKLPGLKNRPTPAPKSEAPPPDAG